MRRALLHALLLVGALAVFGSCVEQESVEPLSSGRDFYASTEGEGRVYADADLHVYWNAGDRIAVFDRSTAGSEYAFQGSTGDKSGLFSMVSGAGAAGGSLDATYAVYPYGKDVSVNGGGEISLTIPAFQTYVPGTFAPGVNLMAAATTGQNLEFRNICGILALQLCGDGTVVKKLELSGNAGESLAGPATVSISPGGEPATTLAEGASKSIILDCGNGVTLSSGGTTEFWFVLPPVNFTKGFTVTVYCYGGQVMLKRGKAVEIMRSRVSRMEATTAEPLPTIGTGLRSVFITTPTGSDIYSKDEWTSDCTVVITDDNGQVYYRSSEVGVKGRGNSTWSMPKKPYTLKLPEKEDLIGVGAKGKRWVLLANWMDRTLLRHDVSFELARRTSLEWTPSGEFVELFLNGRHLGNYWLGEQIKVGKGRLTADFLIEMDTYYDAQWRFYSYYGYRVNQNAWGMPIGVKEPDDDEMNQELLDQLKGLVDGVETSIYYTGDYASRINVSSFIDWYLVHEVTGNEEPNHPKSSYFYFRDGVMYAGPVWDFDWYTFHPGLTGLCIPNSIYFNQLLQYPEFVSELKAHWAEIKPLWSDIPDYIDARVAQIRASEQINRQMWPNTDYDVNGDCYLSYPDAITRMKQSFTSRMKTLDTAIKAL